MTPPHILLVEDHEDNRVALLAVLRREGYDASGARNGVEALEMIAQRRPALVLMDLAMPVMDGREATRRLKAEPATNDIPVLALTAMSLSVSWESLQHDGFSGLLTKPCMPPQLIAEVRRLAGPARAGAEGSGR
jgi:two-component system, cell cycle response regulator DivK